MGKEKPMGETHMGGEVEGDDGGEAKYHLMNEEEKRGIMLGNDKE